MVIIKLKVLYFGLKLKSNIHELGSEVHDVLDRLEGFLCVEFYTLDLKLAVKKVDPVFNVY